MKFHGEANSASRSAAVAVGTPKILKSATSGDDLVGAHAQGGGGLNGVFEIRCGKRDRVVEDLLVEGNQTKRTAHELDGLECAGGADLLSQDVEQVIEADRGDVSLDRPG